jgi:hypothetical protein
LCIAFSTGIQSLPFTCCKADQIDGIKRTSEDKTHSSKPLENSLRKQDFKRLNMGSFALIESIRSQLKECPENSMSISAGAYEIFDATALTIFEVDVYHLTPTQ